MGVACPRPEWPTAHGVPRWERVQRTIREQGRHRLAHGSRSGRGREDGVCRSGPREDGIPHLGFQVGIPSGPLWYATQGTSGWEATVLDSGLQFAWRTAIAVDTGGYPHIAYHSPKGFGMNHAFRDTAGWHIEEVDLDGCSPVSFCLILDVNGQPHIGYRSEQDDDLAYVWKAGGSCTVK